MKLWIGTETLSCDSVMICARNQKEAIQLLYGTIYQTELRYFRDQFVLGGTEVERQVCKNLTVPGVWKVERNRMCGLPKDPGEYVPVKPFWTPLLQDKDTVDALGGRQEKALTMARNFSYVRNAQKKQWIIDQMVRVLCGDQYDAWVKNYNDTDPSDTWDTGEAP